MKQATEVEVNMIDALANAQIDEENHLHSLSSKKGINFRE